MGFCASEGGGVGVGEMSNLFLPDKGERRDWSWRRNGAPPILRHTFASRLEDFHCLATSQLKNAIKTKHENKNVQLSDFWSPLKIDIIFVEKSCV